ncbi:MAG: RNA polymerase sigma factor [Planctomycetota bacterium]
MGVVTACFPPESMMITRKPDQMRLDRDGFVSLLAEHGRTLRFIAAAYVGASDAEDIVQKAAAVALPHADDFEPGTSFSAWMGAFVRNEARNARRSERRHRLKLTRFREHRRAENERRTVEPETLARLRHCLEGLTEVQRECILLRVVGDHSYEQIATITGEPANTARSHVHRSRARLATCLEGHQEGVSRDV